MEYRLGSALLGIGLLAMLVFFTAFPQLKPDWIQIGNGRGPARAGSFHARNTSWSPDPKSAEACFYRGVAHLEKEQWDQAIKEFNEVIRLEPNNPKGYYNRGFAWASKQKYNEAISDFDAFLRLRPDELDGLISRAEVLAAAGQTAQALTDLDAAIRLAPDDVDAYCIRGKLREEACDYRLALEDYMEAVRRQPDDPAALNYLAWLMATAPEPEVRDGRRAVAAALHAVELDGGKQWETIDTLAAAFAETGKFSQAIRSQTEALRLAPPEEHNDLRSRLELYQAQKRYRLPNKTN
jgi:tetratricopeptide (TPR) repeat protein